ncbi:MAG: peptidoglycan DD-metalloendopeptidase family protein [Leptospiraceae bacterium]|nr:peptidoglycan DD-metalloendopeptidase family protein [Leptospiraceae bacterium]
MVDTISMRFSAVTILLAACAVFPLMAEGNSSEPQDLIDDAIEKYFSGIKSATSADIDQKKLEQAFGKRTPAILIPDSIAKDEASEKDSSESFSFSNASESEEGLYTVKSGDTYYSISKDLGISVAMLKTLNPDVDQNDLAIGQKLKVKGSPKPVDKKSYYVVKKGDTLYEIARSNSVDAKDVAAWNKMDLHTPLKVGQKLLIFKKGLPEGYSYRAVFIRPISGPITSGYGRRPNPFARSSYHFHKGIDIGAPMGTEIKAARDGLVIFSGRMNGYGNVVFLRHADGYVSVYAHARLRKVEKGDIVRQGQVIAEVGRTGAATGPHLHFEVRKLTQPMNPFVALSMKEAVPTHGQAAYKD